MLKCLQATSSSSLTRRRSDMGVLRASYCSGCCLTPLCFAHLAVTGHLPAEAMGDPSKSLSKASKYMNMSGHVPVPAEAGCMLLWPRNLFDPGALISGRQILCPPVVADILRQFWEATDQRLG